MDKSLIALKNYVRKDGMFSEIFHFFFNHDQVNDSYMIVVMVLSPIREFED